MARYKSKIKPGGGAKAAPPASTKGLIPCALLLLAGIALFSAFFYFFIRSGVSGVPK
jgi:hypothetical protein